MAKHLVVLPSYNERENLWNLIEAILQQGANYFVCVVDDNSPDGTSQHIRSQIDEKKLQERVHLIVRQKKDGRGGAVRDGFRWGLTQSEITSFAEMDCDFSHPPTDLPKGFSLLAKADAVMGVRYPDGVIIGWPLRRKVLSFCANLLARLLISWEIADYTNGFRFYNKKAVNLLLQIPQRHKGYIFLSESLSYLLANHCKIETFPIRFVNRERGVSNTSLHEVSQAFLGIFSISYRYWFCRSQLKSTSSGT
jgi:dolichol-phosphate mannosyltransferase